MPQHALAHSANDHGNTESLREHLQAVGHRSGIFASAFGATVEATIAGILHDVGKYGDPFQVRLQGIGGGIDHWSPGAWIALMMYRQKGIAAAIAIAGHHAGLRSGTPDALRELDPKKLVSNHPLALRLSEADPATLLKRLEDDGILLPALDLTPDSVFGGLDAPAVGAMLDVRMLFSALVDADFLETEAHFQGGPDGEKRYRVQPLGLLPERALEALTEFIHSLAGAHSVSPEMTSLRNDLLAACLNAADQSPGLFTLTAPTGAGKTLAMLAFALRHAARHRLRRVVTIIPYLTIIEQTAEAYRKVLEPVLAPEQLERYILEHHSLSGTRFDRKNREKEDRDSADSGHRRIRLLSENWDAPIIVTTNVQLLESLFSNRPSACRKLHRLAGSVLLFDEVQTLPADLAVPTLAALSRLTERYGCTVVFSSATQPAFDHLHSHVSHFCASGWQPREIVTNFINLFDRARRTSVQWPRALDEPTRWGDIARQIADQKQALCIVNLKRHALQLFDALHELGVEALFHLSTNMCPAHRSDVLRQIRETLQTGSPCRLISTQCVEAGVDVDFPVAFRAFGPVDAVAQAAGRCNRNGRANFGNVIVFLPEDEGYPDGAYARAVGVTRALLAQARGQGLDIHSPELFTHYYRELYSLANPQDSHEMLQEALGRLDFEAVAKLYRLISQDSINVLVPYDPVSMEELQREVSETGLTRPWIVRARPYAINVYRPKSTDRAWDRLIALPLGNNRLSEEWFAYSQPSHYDRIKGLVIPDSPDCLIA